MAVGRIPVQQEAIFAHGLLYLGFEPAVDFDRRSDADNQQRDKETGQRVWLMSVLNLGGDRGGREITVKVVSDLPPKVPERFLVPMRFGGLSLTPWVNDKGRSQMSFRALDAAEVPSK